MIRSDWLEAFIAFGEQLNFTRAAARLHISQPAFHVQIRRLGETVGATLYERRGRNLALTLQGRELLAFARDARERDQAFCARLGGLPGTSQVVLAAGEGALLYVLGRSLRRVVTDRHVRLRILTRDRDGTVAALTSGEAHLGVLAAEVIPDGLQATRVHRAGTVLIVPTKHRLARKRRVTLADLKNERLIVPLPDSRHRQTLTRSLTAAGIEWDVALEAAGWPLMLDYARLGMGMALVNDICSAPRGTVARRVPELPSIDYFVVERTGAAPSPATTQLRAAIVSAFTDAGAVR